MLWIQNFNIRESKMGAFQRLINKNEKTTAKHAPKGWKYMGTYFYAIMLGQYTGASLWKCSFYADFDTGCNHDDATWLRLVNQVTDFWKPEPVPGMLLREVGESKVIKPGKKP
jgi:hypothetical protein